MLKFFSGVFMGLGILLIAGTAGSSDFYEACRTAADCVAGDPMSNLQMFVQLIGGMLLMVVGMFLMIVSE